jgi:hypothetical protein
MQEPHRKGVANHPDLESCAGGGDIATRQSGTGPEFALPPTVRFSLEIARRMGETGGATYAELLSRKMRIADRSLISQAQPARSQSSAPSEKQTPKQHDW